MAYGTFEQMLQDIIDKLPNNTVRLITESVMRDLLTQIVTFLNIQSGSFLFGNNPPSNSLGADNSFYIDISTTTLYGPKLDGVWPIGQSLKGEKGDDATLTIKTFVGDGITSTFSWEHGLGFNPTATGFMIDPISSAAQGIFQKRADETNFYVDYDICPVGSLIFVVS